MKKKQTTLGIIAGGGALPKALIDTCKKSGRPVFVLALKGHADPTLLKHTPGAFVRLGAVGTMKQLLKKNTVQEIVMIGSVRRPSIREIFPDLQALSILFKVGFKLLGDDSLLKLLIKEADRNGFKVIGIDSLMPEILAVKGVYTKTPPSHSDEEDIKRGIVVAKTLGRVDVGQAAIIQRGLVLAVEGIEGTAALIKRSSTLKRKGSGGVLVKVSKPQQERRVDLPTIGPDTVQAIFDAGLKGIAIEAGSTLLVETERLIKLADQLGIFVIGVTCPKK